MQNLKSPGKSGSARLPRGMKLGHAVREMFACGTRNPGLWNPEYNWSYSESPNDWNPDSKFH